MATCKDCIHFMKKYIIAVVLILLMASTAHAAKPILMEDGTLYQPPRTAVADKAQTTPYRTLTDEEYALVCAVVDLEAGGEGEDLQRAVTEVILNRLDCGLWGSTVTEVVWSPNQFEVMAWLYKANPSELTKRVVKEVWENGSSIPSRVMFFRANHYHSSTWARAEFNVGNVYFSSSKWLLTGMPVR